MWDLADASKKMRHLTPGQNGQVACSAADSGVQAVSSYFVIGIGLGICVRQDAVIKFKALGKGQFYKKHAACGQRIGSGYHRRSISAQGGAYFFKAVLIPADDRSKPVLTAEILN